MQTQWVQLKDKDVSCRENSGGGGRREGAREEQRDLVGRIELMGNKGVLQREKRGTGRVL